jgi:UDP-N-acetylmuramoylalanine--D-glutamate ligase
MPIPSLAGARITVMGLGRFGGGLGVTRWVIAQGARVTVTDLDDAAKLEAPLRELAPDIEAGRVRCVLGEHREADFRETDLVIANPAVPKPWDNRFLRAAADAGVPITTEIRLVCERMGRSRVIGVTGSAGKSTTASMLAHAIRALAGRCRLGGNIGGSLLGEIPSIGPQEWTVLELSSAQLHWLGAGAGYPEAPAWSPGIAVVTSFAPNHIDWHGSLEHYRSSKAHILAGHGSVVVADAATGAHFAAGARSVSMPPDGPRPSLRIPGAHNRRNALVAAEAVRVALGVPIERTLDAVRDFPGLAHRLQLVAEAGGVGGVRAFNDSKSTTPESAALAIAAFDEDGEVGARAVHLICGGYDKKVDLGPMVGPAAACASVSTIGATGPGLAAAICGAGGRAESCGTLDVAVARALSRARPGEVVVLSPGCASWDQFAHFEARGEEFTRLVRAGLGLGPGE